MATPYKAPAKAPTPGRSIVDNDNDESDDDKSSDRSDDKSKPDEPVGGAPGEADNKPNSPYTPIPNDEQKS